MSETINGVYPGVYPILFATEECDSAFVYRPSAYTKPGAMNLPRRRGVSYSPNGKNYFEAVVHGGRSSSSWNFHNHSFEFSIPNSVMDHVKVEYTSEDDIVRIGDRMYHRKGEFKGESKVIPLPQTRHTVYHLTNEDIQIFVDDWDYSDGADDMRLFFNSEQLPIQDVQQLRDGGTTYITTERGVLYVATPFRRRRHDRAAFWTDKNDVKHQLKIEE